MTFKRTRSALIASIGRTAPGSPFANQKGNGVTTCVGVPTTPPKLPTPNPLSFRQSNVFAAVTFSRGVPNSSRTSKSRPFRLSIREPPISRVASPRRACPKLLVQPNRGPRKPGVAAAAACTVAISGMVVTK